MNDLKITPHSFDHGSFHDALNHQMHRAEISEQGRDRVNDAMKAAIAHVAHKEDLRNGVGGHHVDEALHFMDTFYEGRHDLQPKERELIESTFRTHFGLSGEKEAA